MLGFVIFLCLAFTQAERLGYSYGQGGSHSAFENRYRHRAVSTSTTLTPTINTQQAGTELSNGRGGYSGNSIQSGNSAGPVETRYNKEFYTYSAPEDDFRDIEAAQRLALSMRKNLRVVFIKTPENNGLTNAALQLAKQNAESKTAIYVLTKQTDVAELVNQLQNIQPSQDTKPEVHFVKYRTPEDAVQAQQIIQSEYDTLGGTSRVVSQDIAPVLDFTSKKQELVSDGNVNNINIGPMNRVAVMLNSYLPPKSRQ